MILFPAIDLKDGQCVRLLRGEMEEDTVFNDNPGQQAKSFVDDGCEWLHVVDLNGAFAGQPVNSDAVDSILKSVDVPVQLGGGIRDLETIEFWLNRGVSRVIMGTAAVENPGLVAQACDAHPGKIAVAIDCKGGFVATGGWAEVSELEALDLAINFDHAGVAAIIYTDIERDGAMEGPNIETTQKLATSVDTPVIASGGVSSMEDLKTLQENIPNLSGIITGRAVYDGRINIAEAVKLLK